MVADMTDNDAVMTNFIFAYDYGSIPVNIVIPGKEDKPAITIDGPVSSGAPFVEMIEKAVQ